VATNGKSVDTEDIDRVMLIWVWMFRIRCPDCDIGPGKILVDPDSRGLGIIDWEIAGHVRRSVKTQLRLSLGMGM
jgi:hypothetical protein